MSSLANWAYTAKATIWVAMEFNDYTGQQEFALPVVIDCDYGSEFKRMNTAAGEEFTSKQTIDTEYSTAKDGDYILIGESSEVDPIAAGADKIMLVVRYADTFERKADDYRLVT